MRAAPGCPTPIDCPALQGFGASQADGDFYAAIADCGEQLNRRSKRSNGEFIHASDLFGTVDAVEDMAAVIEALRVGRVDLYGDSYGSFFAQAFAARHPEMLRSLTLDGTWPLLDANPWYPETPATIRFAFDAVCERSAACAAAAPGSATARLASLQCSGMAASPAAARCRDRRQAETVTGAARPIWRRWHGRRGRMPRIYRDLDAAGRAALAGDPRRCCAWPPAPG